MLYGTSPEFFHLLIGSLYPLTTFTHFPHSLPLRNGIFPAILNEDVTVMVIAATTEGELVSPGGNSGRKEALLSSSHQTSAIPHGKPRGSSECENHKILAPDS